MENSGLSASDVLALTRENGDVFGGVGGFVLLFIFLMALSGNGFWGGNTNSNMNQMATADLLYNQSTDSAIRGLAQGQCNIVDTVLNANYNNLLASKDVSNQISNQTLALTGAMAQNTNAILAQMNTNTIDGLRDALDTTRAELSNVKQTARITENILDNLATTAPKMPCSYPYCNCNRIVSA